MKAVRYGVGLCLGFFLAAALYGCSAPADAEPTKGNGGMYQDTWHKMPDGRTVYCLYIETRGTGYADGSLSFECDFAGAVVHP